MERESSSDVRGGKSHQNSAEEASMRHIAQVNGILSYTASWLVSEDRNILQASVNTFLLNMKLLCRSNKKTLAITSSNRNSSNSFFYLPVFIK
jgi:hypothetical protein